LEIGIFLDKTDFFKVTFNATGFASGLYFYKINMKEFEDTKKMLLLK